MYGFRVKNIIENETTVNNTISLNQSIVVQDKVDDSDLYISYRDAITYLYDSLENKYIIITPTYLGENVAYSLTYKSDDTLPSGYMQNTEYFAKEHITTILSNGYPYISYSELGLKDENEAYAATQLAIYDVLTQRDVLDMKDGKLRIANVSTNIEDCKEKCERIKKAATKLSEHAMNNTYINYYNNGINGLEENKYNYNAETETGLFGPFTSFLEYTDEAKRIGLKNSSTKFNIINLKEDISKVSVVNEQMNEVESIDTNSPFYIKIDGEDKYCAVLIINNEAEFLISNVYTNKTSKNRYVTLQSYTANYTKVQSFTKGIEVGKITVENVDRESNILHGSKYYILNEKGKIVLNVTDFSIDNVELPIGKYYIHEYFAPEDCLLNNNEYEVEITDSKDNNKVTIIHDKLF